MSEFFDVLVLGLGPAGASAAAEAARRGCKVMALDRKREAGVPVQCAEFVPVLLAVDPRAVRQPIDSMLTYVEDDPPDVRPDFPGRMLDRAAFDASLAQTAKRAGAQVRFSCLVSRVEPDGVIESTLGRWRARVIIGADGPRSRAGRAIGSANTEVVETRQVTVPLAKPYPATDIFLSAGIPGGYGWLFPKAEVANLGAGVVPQYRARLKAIVARLHEELVRKERVGRDILCATGGAIPVGGLRKPWGRVGETAVLLAGDAAGLAHPVTGAGIAAAVHSGRLAGQAAATGAFHEYVQELEAVYGAALERALRRRRELLASIPEKAALRRGWIAYPEYWT